MIVKLRIAKNECVVKREDGDKVFRSTEWASAESTFLYHVKKVLAGQGLDLIKKRMWKDGHLVNDNQQYLRSRNTKKDSIGIYNGGFAEVDAGKAFNERGCFILNVTELSQ